MADASPTTPAPTAPVVKAPRDNALQNQKLANAIAASERHIKSVLGNPDLLLALAPIGFNETALNEGLALFKAAQEKYSARQQALASATAAKATRDHAFNNAKIVHNAYRQTVQVNYSGADRANLGATGKVPADIEKFRTNARSAYTTASKAPYVDVLAKYGFGAERLAAALAGLDELSTTDSAAKSAHGTAMSATEIRDEAGAALSSWMAKFRKLSRTALKSKPELLALLAE